MTDASHAEVTPAAPKAPAAPTAPAAPSNEATPPATPVADGEASQIASLETDLLNSMNEVEEVIPEHMRGNEETPTPETPAAPATPAATEPPVQPATPTPATPETPQTPEVPPATPEPKAPATPEAQPQPGGETPPEPQTPAEETPAQPQGGPEEFARQRQEWRANAERQLAENQYQAPQELVDELGPETAKLMSNLASKVYLDAVEGATIAIMSHLPTIIQQVSKGDQTNKQFEDKFFEMWPQLKRDDPQHQAAIRRIAGAYRAANSKIDPDAMMRDVGAATVIGLKLPVTMQTPPAAVTPAAPHQPLRGGGPVAPPTERPTNVFERLDEDVEALER